MRTREEGIPEREREEGNEDEMNYGKLKKRAERNKRKREKRE